MDLTHLSIETPLSEESLHNFLFGKIQQSPIPLESNPPCIYGCSYIKHLHFQGVRQGKITAIKNLIYKYN